MIYPGVMQYGALHTTYLPTLLLYYEEEIMGETYFYALGARRTSADVRHRFELLAKVERHAAAAVQPLLEKYELTPRSSLTLEALGLESTKAHLSYSWPAFVAHMLKRYPLYMDDFHGLESMAPDADQPYLKALTAHETAAIEFANREKAGDEQSIDSLTRYLSTKRPVSAGKNCRMAEPRGETAEGA